MKNFRDNKGGFNGPKKFDSNKKPSFENKSWGVDRGQSYGSNRDRPLYKATCSECGKSCEVPFRPTGEKPVFCSDCFNKMRDVTDTRGGAPSYGDRGSNNGSKREFNDRHAPRFEAPRPAYSAPAAAPVYDETKKQLAEIGSKLDRLLSAIEKMSAPKATTPAPVAMPVAPKTTPAPAVKKETEKAAKKAAPKAVAKKVESKPTAKKVATKTVAKKKK